MGQRQILLPVKGEAHSRVILASELPRSAPRIIVTSSARTIPDEMRKGGSRRKRRHEKRFRREEREALAEKVSRLKDALCALKRGDIAVMPAEALEFLDSSIGKTFFHRFLKRGDAYALEAATEMLRQLETVH